MPVREWDNITPSVGIFIVWIEEVLIYATTTLLPMITASFMEIIGIALIPETLTSIQTAAKEKPPCRTQRIMPGGVVAESNSLTTAMTASITISTIGAVPIF